MPPCNCHHPFPRPEPFSPLPRPGKVPDWGKWIRDRLAEKGALLAFPSVNAFPDPGAGPNLYLAEDTDIVYRWDGAHYQVVFDPDLANDVLEYEDRGHFPETGHHGKLYIAADTGSLYRWGGEDYVDLLPGKADKAVPQTAGNLAALAQDGNLADSGKKPSDFQPTLTFDSTPTAGSQNPVTSEGIKSAIDAATPEDYAQVKAQVQTNTGNIADIKAVVPSAATERNPLVDTVTMNSSIATNTAHFLGTKSYVTDLGFPQPSSAADVDNDAIATALGGLTFEQTPTNNDYVFVSINYTPTTDVDEFRRFKFNDTTGTWAYEYTLNNSSFTAAQWAAINSGITSGAVAQLVHKRDYTDRSYNTQVTVNAPALHAILTSRGTQILEYYLPCTEDIPATPEINHDYTWRRDGAEFFIEQGVSALTTIWTLLYSSTGEQLASTTTDNATQGYFPDLTFETSAYTAVTSTKVNSYPDEVQDALALDSNVPSASTTLPKMDSPNGAVVGTSAAYARGDHVHPTDTSRMAATATGADININNDSQATSINTAFQLLNQNKQDALSAQQLANIEAVPDKLDKSGGTMTGPLTEKNGLILGKEYGNDFDGFRVDSSGNAEMTSHAGGAATIGAVISATQEMPNKANRAPNPTAGNLAALDASGNPTDSGVKASDKLDASSASAPFSSDSSTQYAVGSHCTYNGKLYKCTTATTGGTWDASKWTADTMTDPDAVLDITAQNQLRVVAKDGTVLWAQGYDLASTSSATLACDATNNFTFADGATTQAFTLPTAPTGKVGDFGLDIDNSANTGAATISFTNITNNTASVVIPKGENLNDMLAIAAGELARFYITLSTFRVNNLPTWHIVKQVVENGGAQS